MRQPELDNSLSNKDRFDKLKESRQKYKEEAFEQKEEARRAGQKIELLTKQLQMLMQQVSGSDEAAETKNKRENDSLRTKIEVTTLEMQRQQKLHATRRPRKAAEVACDHLQCRIPQARAQTRK